MKGLEILGKDIIRNLATRYILTNQGFKEFEEKLLPNLERLTEIDKDTIYFDGIKKIEDEIAKIFQQYPNSRIVIFIDDLDRCSPETTLEVFESVKAFLDIEGFIFILGLSREALDKLITKKFEQMGLTGITGEQYIRKVIQIEINIQKWKPYAINELIAKLSKRLDYDDLKKPEIIDLIAKGVERNPRQVKRLINRYIVVHSASKTSNRPFEAKKFFVGEILNDRWPDFYSHLTNPNFLKELKDYLNKKPEEQNSFFATLQENKNKEKNKSLGDFEEVILSHKGYQELWNFVTFNRKTIFVSETIAKTRIDEVSTVAKDWERYKRAGESTNIPIAKEDFTSRLLKMLQGGQVKDFNLMCTSVPLSRLKFVGANFREAGRWYLQ